MDEWIYFLKNEMIKDGFTAKGLEEAQATLDVLKMNKDEREEYERHQVALHREASLHESTYVLGEMKGMEKDMNKGIKIGKEEGIEEGILRMARKMKHENFKVNIIAQMTRSSIEKIELL